VVKSRVVGDPEQPPDPDRSVVARWPIRLAVGARTSYVLIQFLGEAMVLSTFGGVLVVILSVLGAWGIERWLGWSLSLSPAAVALAVASSMTTGLVFGLYPAWRAARLDPIVALQHE